MQKHKTLESTTHTTHTTFVNMSEKTQEEDLVYKSPFYKK
jgi:hypothetical protein